ARARALYKEPAKGGRPTAGATSHSRPRKPHFTGGSPTKRAVKWKTIKAYAAYTAMWRRFQAGGVHAWRKWSHEVRAITVRMASAPIPRSVKGTPATFWPGSTSRTFGGFQLLP